MLWAADQQDLSELVICILSDYNNSDITIIGARYKSNRHISQSNFACVFAEASSVSCRTYHVMSLTSVFCVFTFPFQLASVERLDSCRWCVSFTPSLLLFGFSLTRKVVNQINRSVWIIHNTSALLDNCSLNCIYQPIAIYWFDSRRMSIRVVDSVQNACILS